MKLRALMITVVFVMSFLITGILYAGNGDLIVNGNLGVGTSTPAAKAEVNGDMIVDGSSTVKGNTTTNGNTTTVGNTIVNGNLGVGTSTPAGKAEVNGNMIVDGNLGVGTTTPTQKLDVNGKVKGTGLCIGSNCTTTLHVSGGLYGICEIISNSCGTVKSPSSCAVEHPSPLVYTATCSCPTGYTVIRTGGDPTTVAPVYYSCYKN